LIDEVDVFFSEHFYGKTFNPVTKFKDEKISKILKLIWDKSKPRGGISLITS
jgi:hypothetical protein